MINPSIVGDACDARVTSHARSASSKLDALLRCPRWISKWLAGGIAGVNSRRVQEGGGSARASARVPPTDVLGRSCIAAAAAMPAGGLVAAGYARNRRARGGVGELTVRRRPYRR